MRTALEQNARFAQQSHDTAGIVRFDALDLFDDLKQCLVLGMNGLQQRQHTQEFLCCFRFALVPYLAGDDVLEPGKQQGPKRVLLLC